MPPPAAPNGCGAAPKADCAAGLAPNAPAGLAMPKPPPPNAGDATGACGVRTHVSRLPS
jgi:hypothetical protein